MRLNITALLAILILSLAALAGCGDDDSRTSASGAAAEADGGTEADGATETDGRADDDAGANSGASGGVDGGSGDGGGAGGDSGSDGGATSGGSDQAGAEPNAEAGSEQGGETGEGAGPASEEFIAQANTICTEGSKKLEERTKPYLERNVKKGEETAVLGEIINQVLSPTIEEEIEGISALGIPAGDERQVEAIFAAMRKVVAQAKADPAAFSTTVEPFEAPEELAIAYGLGACGGV